MFYDPAQNLSDNRKEKKAERPCSKRHSDAFLKVEVRDVGAFLLMLPSSLQPQFSLTCSSCLLLFSR